MFDRLQLSTLLAMSLLAAGCGDVESLGHGELALTWQVSPSGCAEAGVQSVEVRVTGPEARIERFSCERGEADFNQLDPGLYEVEILGFDPNGDATFAADTRTVTVDADRRVSAGTLRLVARPATVSVGWVFDNGRVCGANGVAHVVVAVFDELDYEVDRRRFACDNGSGTIDGLRAGSYLVEANGLDADSNATWKGTIPVKVDRGDAVAVELELATISN